MNEICNDIFTAIINSTEPCIPTFSIYENIRFSPDETEEALIDLEEAKLIATWNSDDGVKITLTPLAAERLNVRLTESGWKSKNISEKSEMVDSVEIGVVSAINQKVRPALPEKEAISIQRFDQFSLPYPNVLLGAGTALWDNVSRFCCPSCNNKDLQTNEYCLRCDNWGMDKYLKKTNSLQVSIYGEHKAKNINMVKRVKRNRSKNKILTTSKV